MNKPILARDLGDGPHRPFGSALVGIHGNDPLATPPLVARTVKPRAAGPCPVCQERRFFCECDETPRETALPNKRAVTDHG